MSEKIYVWLLRLFPSHFRQAYGDDALQLFRDRARDEKGFFLRLRLWVDLLVDLVISVPRQYRYVQPELLGVSAQHHGDGGPSFYVLEDKSPRLGALLFGGVLTLAGLFTLSILLSYGAKHRASNAFARRTQHAATARSSAYSHAAPLPGDDTDENTIASSSQRQPSTGATFSTPDEARASDSQSKAVPSMDSSRFSPPQALQSPDAAIPMTRAAVANSNLDAAERQRVVEGAIANLKKFYIYPDVAQKTADALLAHEKSGQYDAVTDGDGFANLLTKQMREQSQDMHLILVYSKAPLPEQPRGPTPEGLARYRETMKQENCTFEKAETLPHNIGYLKLNFFPDTSICQPTAEAAMASLNHADAIIFDLRDNRGGEPEMVALMAAYLFDHPEYWYNPRENTTQQSWTLSPVPGNRLADKPVYVLTSARTFSGAEQFCYDLKMLKRATLVGETTGGAAHSGVFHRIDDHFGMGIPEVKSINPFSKTDWEGTGVEPDVKVNAADALETAVKLAESKLRRK